MEFTHLHGHSTYSFLEAIGTPKKLVEKSKELGFKAIGLTDLFSMYGAVKLYESCKENGINPIIGTELGFVLNMTGYNKVEDIGNVCLLATNTEGYQNLMKIVSCANEEGIAGKPKIDIDVIGKNSGGIIAFMGGESSWIGKMIYRSESDDKILEIIHMLQDKLGKENVFLEIVAQDENKNQLLGKINKKILGIAEAEGIGVITGNVYNYIEKKDREAWEMALAIKDGKKMFDADRRKPVGDFSLLTGDEIYDILVKNNYSETSIKKWIETNNEIAKKISIEIIMGQALFPVYQTPKDVQELYDNIKDSLISD